MNDETVSPRRLIAFVLGELGPDATADIEARVARAPALHEAVDEIRRLIATLETDDTRMPPDHVIERAADLLQTARPAARADWLGAARRLIAEICFDSRREATLAGFRGRSEAFQLTYLSERGKVDLDVRSEGPAADRWQIQGQCREGRGHAMLLERGTDRELDRANLSVRGYFKLAAGPGDYDVLLVLEEDDILLPRLRVG